MELKKEFLDPMDPLLHGPEDYELNDWEKLFSWTSLVGPQARLFRRYRRYLMRRDPELCMKSWPQNARIVAVMKEVSRILAEYFRWPVDRFVPEDRFNAIFWEPAGDLLAVEAELAIDEAFSLPDDFPWNSFIQNRRTLGEVVIAISECRISESASGADPS